MNVMPLDKSNKYFQVSISAVEWFTACEIDSGWHIVNMHGRVLKPDGKRGKSIILAVKNAQKMAVVRAVLG